MTNPRPSLRHMASHLDWLTVAIWFVPFELLAAWEHALSVMLVVALFLPLAALSGHVTSCPRRKDAP